MSSSFPHFKMDYQRTMASIIPGGCSSPKMLQVPSNPQYLELPVTDTEMCVLGVRLPFETCILWSHTQNYCALYCEAYRRLTVPNRKCLPHPFSILSENNILGCDWVSEKHFNIYPTRYFRQFLFFSWGAHWQQKAQTESHLSGEEMTGLQTIAKQCIRKTTRRRM